MALTDKDINNIIGDMTSESEVVPSDNGMRVFARAMMDRWVEQSNGDLDEALARYVHSVLSRHNHNREWFLTDPAFAHLYDFFVNAFAVYDEKIALGWTP